MSNTQTLEIPGYQVIRFLGSGARSTIWLVRDRQSDEVYALKRVIRKESSDMRFLEQAINEYEIGSRLEHPRLRRVHSIRKIKRWLALREIHVKMEFCDGKTVQENRPRDMGETVRIFIECARALAHMNSKGFVHADTKPNNIVVGTDGNVKVIDLGQSCPIGTVKARIQGTPDFIAPEQVRRRPVDARTDVFNLGAALYWTATGRPIPTVLPKAGSLTLSESQRVLRADAVNPDVPEGLAKLIADCIQLHPTNRPSSINEVASRLGLIARRLHKTKPGTS